MIFNIIVTAVLVCIDQWSKYLATRYLIGNGTVVVIPHLLGLRYVENTGAAFSMLSNSTDFLIVVTAIALAVMAYMFWVKNYGDTFEKICFTLIIAGGIGNLIDRVLNGFVVDYFEFLFMDFAVFNVADVYVCTGIALYAVYTVYTEYYRKKRGNNG
ncbi:MAG: signal peptidase II [Oscillospiraceae bacterium]|nr:signal peptidase II [Oscillospiraceae bacterium]